MHNHIKEVTYILEELPKDIILLDESHSCEPMKKLIHNLLSKTRGR
jgi:hypothetical protein